MNIGDNAVAGGSEEDSHEDLMAYAWDEAKMLDDSAHRLRGELAGANSAERCRINGEATDLLMRSSETVQMAKNGGLSLVIRGVLEEIQGELQGILRESSEHITYRHGPDEWLGGKEYVS